MNVAYFISAHGFGHAARACGVIEAVWRRQPTTHFELLTTTPSWFFEQSLSRRLVVHEVATDLGLVQANPLQEDLDATLDQLAAWIPFSDERIDELAEIVTEMRCDLVLCDIAPIGLTVARRCGLPSALIENFTWDWIYRSYASRKAAFEPIADYLGEVFDSADLRIQTEPLCRPTAGSLRVGPISRMPREDRETIRRRLAVPSEADLIMVTMGGIEWDYEGVEDRLAGAEADAARERWLVVPGGHIELRRHRRAVLLPHRSDFFHPDLVHAADAVIGKLGYSTVAEIDRAGVPFGYVPRSTFPESPPLEAWVERHLPSQRIDPQAFVAWTWLDEIESLLELPRPAARIQDAATVVADRVLALQSPVDRGTVRPS